MLPFHRAFISSVQLVDIHSCHILSGRLRTVTPSCFSMALRVPKVPLYTGPR